MSYEKNNKYCMLLIKQKTYLCDWTFITQDRGLDIWKYITAPTVTVTESFVRICKTNLIQILAIYNSCLHMIITFNKDHMINNYLVTYKYIILVIHNRRRDFIFQTMQDLSASATYVIFI